jgi:iron complex transport system substrate-binding protein
MESKSNARDGVVANFRMCCAGMVFAWLARAGGYLVLARLPVWNLGKRRTGRSACATWVVFLFLCGDMRAAQIRVEQTTPRESGRLTHTLLDETGRKVVVPQDVDRVVSLAPNLTEIVFALGDGNHLAGDTDYCDYPAEALQKPHVGGTVNPNMEQIVALMPDVVLATSINRRETVSALGRIGLPVFVTDPQSVEGMISTVEHIGNALGVEKSATEVAGDLRARLADLDRRLAGAALRRVLFVVWTDPLISVGRDTFIADALRRAGGRSVVNTKAEWPHVSMEEIVRLQPEVLVFASAHAGNTQRDIDALRARPGWRSLEAMKRGDIVVVSDAINRPAPRMVDAIEQLARALHPDAFTARAVPSVDSGAGFSLWRFVSARTKPHRLKPAPLRSDPIVEEACACGR